MKKHHSLLEEKCHTLDEEPADCLARQERELDINKSTHFGKYESPKKTHKESQETQTPRRRMVHSNTDQEPLPLN